MCGISIIINHILHLFYFNLFFFVEYICILLNGTHENPTFSHFTYYLVINTPTLNSKIRSFINTQLFISHLVSFSFFRYYNNAYYAKVGGISTTEMNLLEVDFLFGLGFQLNVTPNTFHTYCSFLQREMLLLQSPLHLVEPTLNLERPIKLHCCFNEDDSTHKKRLAV